MSISDVIAQKEANNWYFGSHAGITYDSGIPIAVSNCAMLTHYGTSSMSDSSGNLLFYTDGKTVYNKNHEMMPNGGGLLGFSISQVCISVKKPHSDHLYYIFTVGDIIEHPGLYYSEVDMHKDGGLGDIDQFKNIPLTSSNLAVDKITAVKHANNEDVWVIVRQASQPINQYHTYLITSGGVNSIPKITSCLSNVPQDQFYAFEGQMKVSPDGKYLISAIASFFGGYEVNKFDTENGIVTPLYNFKVPLWNYHNWGIEFSSDLRYAYLNNFIYGETNIITQFDLSLIENEDLFVASMKEIGIGGDARDLQIGPDGKIYVSRYKSSYLGVINNPSLPGTACDYDSTGVYLGGGGRLCYYGLPQFIQTYFLRFEYEGKCAGEVFTFTPNFNPVPDSIHWDFGDPGSGANNESNELSPEHLYEQGGDYTVTAFVRYPDGRIEETNREVTVIGLPEPYPAGDTTICMGNSVWLEAVSGYESYLWKNGETTPAISVADTGLYWVEAVNADGCTGRDSVNVEWYPVPVLDDTHLVISPTTCGNSTGAFRGLTLTGGMPPYTIEWINNAGDVLGTELDLLDLPVDNYYLWISDQSGCRYNLFSDDIQNIDSTLIIEDVIFKDEYCHQSNGKLKVLVAEGLSDMLWFSVDNGTNYIQNEGEFTGLPEGTYVIRVKDSEGCVAVYGSNPVKISNIEGVIVNSVISTPETDANANGSIIIHATGDTVLFSLDGSAPQTDSLFSDLAHGSYMVNVTDVHGCDSTFQVEVPWETGQVLHAIAGDTMVCKGLMATEPLLVSNFKDITSFELTLNYNSSLLQAVGYNNAREELIAGLVPIAYPGSGIITVKWTSTSPVTLEDNAVLFDLVMQSTGQGNSTVDWDITGNATWFSDLNGNLVSVLPKMGNITVNPAPDIWSVFEDTFCEGSTMSQMAIAFGGTGDLSVTWQTPNGIKEGMECRIDSITQTDAGLYRVKIVDDLNCMVTDSVQVKVIPLPEAGIETINDTIYFSEKFHLEATPGYYIYIWSTGENNNFIEGDEEGNYGLIIKTEQGCADTTKYMLINTSVDLRMPDAFTPNDDSLNDTFKPLINLEKVRQFSMTIYDKWGQRIYETHDLSNGWTGENTAKGIYLWQITYTDLLGKPFQLRGTVALIK